MKKTLIFVGVLIVIVFVVIYFSLPKKGYDTNIEVVEISSINHSSKLFIKKKTWGMTGDGQVIVISNSDNKEFEPDRTKDYVFEGSSPLFYKVKGDTILLYTYQASLVPSSFTSNFIIRQVELDNPSMMNLLANDNFKTQGLSIIK